MSTRLLTERIVVESCVTGQPGHHRAAKLYIFFTREQYFDKLSASILYNGNGVHT